MNDYISDINKTQFNICNGSIVEMNALNLMSIDEYYTTLDTFIRVQDQRQAELDKLKNKT